MWRRRSPIDSGRDIDVTIAFMGDHEAGFCAKTNRLHNQLRQQLPSWSGLIASWLDQHDIPVHLVRYEDLKTTPPACSPCAGFQRRPVSDEQIRRAVAFADFAQLRQQEQSKGFREAPRPHTAGNFFRRGTAGGRDELTPEQAARIETAHGGNDAAPGLSIAGVGTGADGLGEAWRCRARSAALRRFAQVDNRRRALVLEAVACLLLARLGLIFVPFPKLARRLGDFVPPSDPRVVAARARGPQQDAALAQDIGWAVTRSARYLPFKAVCLP